MGSKTAIWVEGDNGLEPEDPEYLPAIDANGQRLIKVFVTDAVAWPLGYWQGYVIDNDYDAAGTAIGLWKAFGEALPPSE